MSMVEPDSLSAGGTGDTPPPSGGSGGFQSWSPAKKIGILGSGGIAVLGLIYLYAKHKSTSSASTSSTVSGGTGTTPTLVLPSSSQDAVGSSDYASLASGLGNLSNQVSTLSGSTTAPTTPTTTTTSTPVAASPTVAPPPTQVLSGAEYYVLGPEGPNGQDEQNYNVTSGAPVYFTYSNGPNSWPQLTPKQGPPPSGASNVIAYTPTSTPLSQIYSAAGFVGG